MTVYTRNLVLGSDSYKFSHHLQIPPGTERLYGYLESRGGRYGETVFFGLQYWLKEYLAHPITTADVQEADEIVTAHGLPFNREGWDYVVREHGGRLPIRIKAVPEGTVVPAHNALLTMENTDDRCPWLAGWLETQAVRLWYPVTVCSRSRFIKKIIWEHLVESSSDPGGEIGSRCHDFGSRGVSGSEQAGLGGTAHLVNFTGTDTVEALAFARRYYGADMAGLSIPASEHSTITAWGKEGEINAYRNMIRQFGGKGRIYACVSDSYDIYHAVENLWCGDLLEEVKQTGGTLVIRPDSGDPVEVVIACLRILDRKVGTKKNLAGYKLLPSFVRLIQGDGLTEDTIREILQAMLAERYSASNIAFGCGGHLLQDLNRDTNRFAYKCSSITINGEERDVFKDPVTDKGKRSKRGRLSLVKRNGTYETVPGDNQTGDLLETVFENGEILKETTLAEVRERAGREFT